MKSPSNQNDKTSMRHFRPAWLIALVLTPLAMTWPGPAVGQITNGVFVAVSAPYGKTYAEWSAGWWQWYFSLATTNSPIQDTGPISTGQSGQVWFLGGTFGLSGNQSRVRSGSVPEGTALFIAIMESWADNAGCPPTSYTTADLRSFAASYQNQAIAMNCTIDGHSTVDIFDSVNPYRVQSPVFTYSMPAVHNFAYDLFGATCYFNLSGTPYTVSGAVADGVYLLVAPLSPGAHTIYFEGSYPTGSIVWPFWYTMVITYHLTVVPTPALAMARQGTDMVLSWPQAASWYSLETTDGLSPPNWLPAGVQVQPAGDQYQTTISIGSGSHFFRLRRN